MKGSEACICKPLSLLKKRVISADAFEVRRPHQQAYLPICLLSADFTARHSRNQKEEALDHELNELNELHEIDAKRKGKKSKRNIDLGKEEEKEIL